MIVNLTKKFAADLENSENSKQAQNIALINWEWFGILHATLRKPLQKRRVMAISCNEIVFHFLVSFTLSILFWETLWSYSYCEYNRWKTGWIFRIFLYYYIVLFIITEFICSNQECEASGMINHSWIFAILQRGKKLDFSLFSKKSVLG